MAARPLALRPRIGQRPCSMSRPARYQKLQVAHMKLCVRRVVWLVAYPGQRHQALFDAHKRSGIVTYSTRPELAAGYIEAAHIAGQGGADAMSEGGARASDATGWHIDLKLPRRQGHSRWRDRHQRCVNGRILPVRRLWSRTLSAIRLGVANSSRQAVLSPCCKHLKDTDRWPGLLDCGEDAVRRGDAGCLRPARRPSRFRRHYALASGNPSR